MGTVAVIGGGASGLVAALEAARAGARVLLFEANDRVGKSILATGNGRCNFSNADPSQADWRNARFVETALAAACGGYVAGLRRGVREVEGPHFVADYFSRLGMLWREESEGRLYPLTNKATTVVDVLRAALAACGVEERCGMRAVAVEPADKGANGGFRVRFEDCRTARADAVVIAVGGHIARSLAPESLAFVRQSLVLGPLLADTAPIRGLNNIRVHCAVSLTSPDGALKAREDGEVLFRDYGISGIAVFDLSRHARPGDRAVFDFVPWVRDADFVPFCNRRRNRMDSFLAPAWRAKAEQGESERDGRHAGAADGSRGKSGGPHARTALEWTSGMLLPQVARCVLKAAGIDPNAPLSREGAADVARALKRFSVEVRGVGDARQCQVTRGGLDVRGFQADTLQARETPGLFAAGEALDVDAKCGGFNLHWAWASGMLAGRNAAEFAAGPGEGRKERHA